jgi:hypothetical protein
MRASLNCVPATPDLAKIGAMPFGVVLCPLALPDPRDDPIPVRLQAFLTARLCCLAPCSLHAFFQLSCAASPSAAENIKL